MSNQWDEAKYTQYLMKVVLWPPKQVQSMRGQPTGLIGYTHTFRTVPEPAGMGQERVWTCHSELVMRDVLMQHQFWARMKLAQRSQEVWGEDTSCLNTPTISKCTTPNPGGPPLSLRYHSFQGSAVCCPIRTEVIWAQPSQSPQPGLYPHTHKLPIEAETMCFLESL